MDYAFKRWIGFSNKVWAKVHEHVVEMVWRMAVPITYLEERWY
jgi:hypothetical protein